MSALLGLGSGTAICSSALDQSAWRSFEAVEEAWIRDRHALLLDQCPECTEAAAIDLDLKLAELQRRGLQFQYLARHSPRELRGGMWQLSWLPMSANEISKMMASTPAYRQQEEKIRRLADELRKSPDYVEFRRAQMRLWKTPEYRSVHRRYSGRLQELNRAYGGVASGSY
jgi:hypothetical protein